MINSLPLNQPSKPLKVLKARKVWGLLPVMAAMATLSFAHSAKADLISYYNFNDKDQVGDDPVGAPAAAQHPTISVTRAPTYVQGTNLNAVGTEGPGSATNSAMSFSNTNGNSFQFTLDLTNYQDIGFSFDSQRSNTGPTGDTLQYSVNGGTFVNVGTYDSATAFSTHSFLLDSAVNNQSNVAFKILFGTNGAAAGTERFDNIQVNSGVVATPEPETWAMMALGVAALGVLSFRRKRDGEASAFPTNFAC